MDPELRAYLDDRFGEVNTRLAGMDSRLAEVDARLAEVDARFAEVDARFVEIKAALEATETRLLTEFWKWGRSMEPWPSLTVKD